MNYVVKTERLKNYLYTLGLSYECVRDKTNNQNYVYLFKNTKKLKQALDFYYNFKHEHIQCYQIGCKQKRFQNPSYSEK